ncbi:glycosyltransferase family 4 protein [bacterium]|nr:glycosyltransferase family 4 protein [bacterium]
MRKKKILFVASQINGFGGIQRFNRNLISAFGSHITDVISLVESNKTGGIKKKNKLLFASEYIKKVMTYKPDIIVIGHLNFILFSALRMIYPSKIVIILHGVEAWERRARISSFFRFIDEFWAVSYYTKDVFSKIYSIDNKVKRIFNTLPESWKLSSPTSPNIFKKYFLSVTRLDAQEGYKGIDTTIHAIAKIKNQLVEENWKYIVIASGDDIERHKRLAIDLGVFDFISFQSGVTDKVLKELYSECSFFILPSSGEGFGIVFLEAMAYLKPCIGGKNCGTEDVIDDKVTGFLVEREVDQIAEAIIQLINSEERVIEMGKAGYQKLKDEYIFEHFQTHIKKLITECVE